MTTLRSITESYSRSVLLSVSYLAELQAQRVSWIGYADSCIEGDTSETRVNDWAYTPVFEAKMNVAFKQIDSGEYDSFDTIDDLIADLNARAKKTKAD